MSNPLDYNWREQAKALLASLIAGLTALEGALNDGVVSTQEWTTVAIAAVVAFGTVFGVPNRQV